LKLFCSNICGSGVLHRSLLQNLVTLWCDINIVCKTWRIIFSNATAVGICLGDCSACNVLSWCLCWESRFLLVSCAKTWIPHCSRLFLHQNIDNELDCGFHHF
jgi:hypothetical protein